MAADASNVALHVTIAHILDRLLARHVLHARVDVDDESTIVIPRVFVVHALLHVDVDAVQSVNDALEGMHVDEDIIVHRHVKQLLKRLLRQRIAAVSISGIDLVVARSLDSNARIARNRKQRRCPFLGIDRRDHQGVASPHIVLSLIDAQDHHMDLGTSCDHAVRRRAAHKTAAEEMRRSRHDCSDEQDGNENPDAPVTALLLQNFPCFPYRIQTAATACLHII